MGIARKAEILHPSAANAIMLGHALVSFWNAFLSIIGAWRCVSAGSASLAARIPTLRSSLFGEYKAPVSVSASTSPCM